jgi:hypothetical protein
MNTLDATESARALYAVILKHMRKINGRVSQDKLALSVHSSQSVISGIEDCTRTPGPGLSQAIDAFFGLPKIFEAIQIRIVEETGLPPGFPEYADMEAEATVIQVYENFVIPGLFQTPAFARGVIQTGPWAGKVETLLARRLERQEALRKERPPLIVVLIDEYAVRRSVCHKDVMREQYAHLLELVQSPMIALCVVPADSGLCPPGPFYILELPDRPAVGYVENATGQGALIEGGQALTDLKVQFEMIRNKALSDTESERMIRDLLENLK